MQFLFGNFRWMAILGMIIGGVCGYFFWEESQRIAYLQEHGVEAQANLIHILQQTDSKGRASSWATISWRDAGGTLHRQNRIPVSGTFARSFMRDGRLTRRETRIKYLPARPDSRVLMLDDGMHNTAQTPFMMWLSFAFLLFCAYGWYHLLQSERRWLARQAGAAPA